MIGRLAQGSISMAILFCTVAPAAAQSTREQWLALRQVKENEQALAAASASGRPARTGILNILNLRFFEDAMGRLVGVGEARNISPVTLSYARLEFAFYDSAGSYVGSELAYLHGGRNRRVLTSGLYTNVLEPQAIGFFKVWTTIPAPSMASYVAVSAGEDYEVGFPISPVEFSLADSPKLVGQRFSGSVWQTPAGMARFLREPSVAYFAQVAMATLQDGVITDVQVVSVEGPPFVSACGESTTATVITHRSAQFAIDFERPVSAVRSAFEFEENGISVRAAGYMLDWTTGTTHSFTVARRCGWTAVPNVPWIRVIENAQSAANAGTITFTVEPNPEPENREGQIDVSGMTVRVTQAPQCQIFLPWFLPQRRAILGASGHFKRGSLFTPNCSHTVSVSVSWLRVNGSTQIVVGPGSTDLSISAEPNTTTTSRQGFVFVGYIPIFFEQTPPSREVDFDRNGWLDLLWHHQGDGRVATWLMSGTTVIDGTPFYGGVTTYWRSDTNWKVVGSADMNLDGWVDLVWQNAATGRIDFSAVEKISVVRDALLSPDAVADTSWKIKVVADFSQDGRADLVWQHENDGRLAIWFMNGPTMQSGVPLGLGQVPDLDWKIVGSGDFNRDGWQDLVWQHQSDGRIAVWTMRGATLVAGDLISPGQVFDLNWKIRGVGDINGDDMPDLFWQHRVTGEIGAWLMNGTTMMSGVALGVVPDTNWQIVGPR